MTMTQTTTIETVTVTRPVKVIALICGCISLILLIIAIASTTWLEAKDYRQGLWEECIWTDGEMTCKKNDATHTSPTGKILSNAWIIACGALCIIACLLALLGTILTGFGLASKVPETKAMMYKVAMVIMFLAVICTVISVIVFPIMFMQEINERQEPQWYFGWAYGVAWGAAIFLTGAAVLLLIDKENDEIYYREKTYYSDA